MHIAKLCNKGCRIYACWTHFKKSPFDITIIPTVTYGDVAMGMLAIIQTIIAVKAMWSDRGISVESDRNKKSKRTDKNERSQRRHMVRTELERRNVKYYDDVIIDESVKITYSKIDIDEVDIENKNIDDYYGTD